MLRINRAYYCNALKAEELDVPVDDADLPIMDLDFQVSQAMRAAQVSVSNPKKLTVILYDLARLHHDCPQLFRIHLLKSHVNVGKNGGQDLVYGYLLRQCSEPT